MEATGSSSRSQARTSALVLTGLVLTMSLLLCGTIALELCGWHQFDRPWIALLTAPVALLLCFGAALYIEVDTREEDGPALFHRAPARDIEMWMVRFTQSRRRRWVHRLVRPSAHLVQPHAHQTVVVGRLFRLDVDLVPYPFSFGVVTRVGANLRFVGGFRGRTRLDVPVERIVMETDRKFRVRDNHDGLHEFWFEANGPGLARIADAV